MFLKNGHLIDKTHVITKICAGETERDLTAFQCFSYEHLSRRCNERSEKCYSLLLGASLRSGS